jgi:hypothetical protein
MASAFAEADGGGGGEAMPSLPAGFRERRKSLSFRGPAPHRLVATHMYDGLVRLDKSEAKMSEQLQAMLTPG